MSWPEFKYNNFKETYKTLHRWVQIVGKIRLCKDPWLNHSWSATLYVTSRGLETSAIPNGAESFSIDFDFIDHQLNFSSSNGKQRSLPLKSESVSSFYSRVMDVLRDWDISVNFYPRPNELADDTPFAEDRAQRNYDPAQAHAFWKTLVVINNVFKDFRSKFEGKSSPVHFFWGSFDLAVTRFSGRVAPEYPGGVPHLPNRVAREAYSHEVSSCGFWPGNDVYPHPAFYAYAYPQPAGFEKARVEPSDAFYHEKLREFILPYDAVRNSAQPEKTLMSFLQSTYNTARDLGQWKRELCEISPLLEECQETFRNASVF